MIVLDTNVVSEFAKPPALRNERVHHWVDSVAEHDLWISAITVAEMRTGVELMAVGKRRDDVRHRVQRAIEQFSGSCLPFDVLAAEEYSRISASRRRRGRPIDVMDAQIAAIAIAAGFALATLNVKDFEGIDRLKLIDPSG